MAMTAEEKAARAAERKAAKEAKKAEEEAAKPTLEDLRKKVNQVVGYSAVEYASAEKYNRGKILSGIWPVDLMMRGGFKIGATHEFFGKPQTGKTWLSYRMLGQFQKLMGRPVGFIDLEHTFDPEFARTADMSVDPNDLLLVQVRTGGEAIDILEVLVRDAGICAVVIDSVAAMATKAELEKRGDQDTMGQQAKLMSVGLRKITTVNEAGVTLIFLNQVREKIGGYVGGDVTPGGRALGHYATTRIEFRKGSRIEAIGQDWDDEEKKFVERKVTVGHMVQMQLAKAKCGARLGDNCSWKFWYPDAPGRSIGYSEIDELLIMGLRFGALTRGGGGWYTVVSTGEKFQGDNAMWEAIRDSHPLQVGLRSIAANAVANIKPVGESC